jgi:hypothetical protein
MVRVLRGEVTGSGAIVKCKYRRRRWVGGGRGGRGREAGVLTRRGGTDRGGEVLVERGEARGGGGAAARGGGG